MIVFLATLFRPIIPIFVKLFRFYRCCGIHRYLQQIIEINFSDPLMRYPDDTYLDSSRYTDIIMTMTMGDLTDLFTTTTGAAWL